MEPLPDPNPDSSEPPPGYLWPPGSSAWGPGQGGSADLKRAAPDGDDAEDQQDQGSRKKQCINALPEDVKGKAKTKDENKVRILLPTKERDVP